MCKIRDGVKQEPPFVIINRCHTSTWWGVHEAWTDYFKESLNPLHKGIIPEKVYYGPGQDIWAPSIQEVSDITRKINNRTPCEDSITA
jgi:hypothetical protein